MTRSFLLQLFRHLWVNRLFTGLNILGLSVGICVSWIVFRMVDYEYSFDRKIPDADKVYQVIVQTRNQDDGKQNGIPGVPRPLVNALRNDITGARLVVPMFFRSFSSVSIPAAGGKNTPVENEEEVVVVGTQPDYFEMLDHTWLAGSRTNALDDPGNVVITDELAGKYFPSLSPLEVLGKTIVYDDTLAFSISGVVASLDYLNSFQKFNKAFVRIKEADLNSSQWSDMGTSDLLFIKTDTPEGAAAMLAQMNALLRERNKEMFEKYSYTSWFEFLPLTEKHFETLYSQYTLTTDKKPLNGLMITAVLLLLMACINYINLNTALLPGRAREIGIRKTLGSSVKGLLISFMAETFVVTSLAAVLSFALSGFAVRLFSEFMPEGMEAYLNYPHIGLFMLVLVILISLVSGIYPAWLSAKVSTINVLKGASTRIWGNNRLVARKALIVFQFSIAQLFIAGALVIGLQLQFAVRKDQGFNREAVINFRIPYQIRDDSVYRDKHFTLANELKKLPALRGVVLGGRPLDNTPSFGYSFQYEGDTGVVQSRLMPKYVDSDYLSFYDIKLLAGRNLRQTDSINEIVLNEAALKVFGFKDPSDAIGKSLVSTPGGKSHPVVGVVKDFHQSGVYSKIQPMAIFSQKSMLTTLNVRLPAQTGQWETALGAIESEWNRLYAGVPFKFEFYDVFVGEFYWQEQRTQKLVRTATFVTIFISCLGLFGLARLTAFQRTKEIGIRKVMGASVSGIAGLLSGDFVKLVLVATVVASPIAWYVMNKWLENFAYRIEIEWWMFAVTGLAATVVALATVGWQAVKAAMANPVESLRTE